jgi:hypothetical protein
MKNERSLEFGTGLFVLLGFAALVFLTTQLPGSQLGFVTQSGGYQIEARFENVGDLQISAPVSMAGVKVGRVSGVAFDSTDYRAVVTMQIDSRFDRIPDDSWANIETAGLRPRWCWRNSSASCLRLSPATIRRTSHEAHHCNGSAGVDGGTAACHRAAPCGRENRQLHPAETHRDQFGRRTQPAQRCAPRSAPATAPMSR